MTRKQLKELVHISFEKSELANETIQRIANALTRRELKEYIRMLKMELKRKTVIVTNALPLQGEIKKELENVFVEKKVVYEIDKNLILGTRIVMNDIVYNMNLREQLSDIEEYVSN